MTPGLQPNPPAYIPGEVCATVGLDPGAPPEECLALVKVDVAGDGVSAPAADVPELRDLVEHAETNGVDLKIVVVAHNPQMDTALRDVATAIGAEHPDSTVLVLSPSYVGTYSGQFYRAKLEAAEDHAKTGNPVVSAQHFVTELAKPDLPWTALTMALLLLVAALIAGTRIAQQYSKQR